MEKKISFSEILKKYTMVIVLVFVVIMFSVNTKGVMLLPQNVNNLVAQNAYVFILATGMLFCILTGGNIDLSVGCSDHRDLYIHCFQDYNRSLFLRSWW